MEQDYISSLPDSVLCHILSKLPTRTAVRTSILSKDWVYRWTSVYNIDIGYARQQRTLYSFSCFMDRIVDYVLRWKLVRNFRLDVTFVGDTDSNQFERWLTKVFTANMENLEISAGLCPNVDLPRSFPASSTLTKLKLSLDCTLKVDTQICFPNLKGLCLGEIPDKRVMIVNEQSPNTGPMLRIFPVLEYLELRNCVWVNANSVEIRAPELTKFKVGMVEVQSYSISIVGPKLNVFELEHALPNNFIINAPELAYAALYYCWNERSRLQAHAVLQLFPHLQHLKLSPFAVKELVQQREDFSHPSLSRLKRLQLISFCYTKQYSVLLKPHVFPSLESIDLDLRCSSKGKFEEQRLYLSGIAPQLKEVKFCGYQGYETENRLIKYFLYYGKSLERASIFLTSTHLTESAVTSDLSKFLPTNSNCVILVHKPGTRRLEVCGK